MKVAIISHTEHYINQDGQLVGWGPTINELNHLLEVFEEIYHVAMLYKGEAPPSSLPYKSDRIKFITIPSVGGHGVNEKLKILSKAPKTLSIVSETLKKVDCFQLRTPTGIGVYLIPYLTLFSKKNGWFKYAGNWKQEQPPMGYAFQRWLLKRQKRTVTINGKWPDQPEHCLTFENPCLSIDDLTEGTDISKNKAFDGKFTFCYVGRLEREKGVERIILALTNLSIEDKHKVECVHLVGNGSELSYFKDLAIHSGVEIVFHGFLDRASVFHIYKQSHVFLMPTTASEGFPKVIAEAMNFGCVPLVSDISSIGHYIKTSVNGFLINPINTENVTLLLHEFLNLDEKVLQKILLSQRDIVNKFTYLNYNRKIQDIVSNFD
ncbi:glycosyltransferase [uncultured Psychroserpens sp.]|uniref:glycosyltransferase n=1 Tax=uncultured Psychroserpens sp. TaxID=255436 RepID=UPI002621971D|nr:glycosyltransferase [uncultured Psychroserpens sp.]